MKNYYQIKMWHEKIGKKEEEEGVMLGEDEMDSDETLFNKTYVKQKLELGLNRIWQVSEINLESFCIAVAMVINAYRMSSRK